MQRHPSGLHAKETSLNGASMEEMNSMRFGGDLNDMARFEQSSLQATRSSNTHKSGSKTVIEMSTTSREDFELAAQVAITDAQKERHLGQTNLQPTAKGNAEKKSGRCSCRQRANGPRNGCGRDQERGRKQQLHF